MKLTIIALFIVLIVSVPVYGQNIKITDPNQSVLTEGNSYPIKWESSGISKITIIAYGTRTPIGTVSKGSFIVPIAKSVSADNGSVNWKVPWIDSISFSIKLKGFDSSGRLLKSTERAYEFRPAVLVNREKDGIYLDLHKRTNQRLYLQKDGKITHVYYVSSSENYLWEPLNVHPKIPHDHAGVFHVISKSPDHMSKLFHVHMRWAMQYHGGHYIHATSSNLYYELGRPASHGCNRMTRYDAKQLYDMTPIGTRVEVIGPNG